LTLPKIAPERWLPWVCGLAALFSVHLALRYFGGIAAPGLIAAALLVLVLLTITGCGRLLLRSFGIRGTTESEKTLLGATLGLGLLSQAVFLLAALGILRTWTVSALLGVFWIVGFTELRSLASSLSGDWSLLRDRPLMAGSVLLLLGLMFWLTWVPPHYYDSLVYHLPLAASYAREGALHTRPDLLFSHFPQNAEMLFTLSLLLGSDILAKMFSWLATFLSVWWLLELGKREVPVPVILLACLSVCTHTAVMLLTPTAYVETFVMLWITAAVLSFLRWRADADEDDMPRGWLALAGVFAGLGVGTKYYAGICPGILGLYLVGRWLHSRWPGRESRLTVASRARDSLLFFITAAAAGLPWLLKNLYFIGNPVFPFLYKLFPGRGTGWAQDTAARYFGVMTEYGHLEGGWLKDLLQFPYLAASGSARFGGGADILGSLGWGLLFITLPLAAWAAWRKRHLRWLALYCAAHWALWFSTGVVLRFLVVLVPLLSLLAANGVYQAWTRIGTAAKTALAGALGILLWMNLALFLYVNIVVDNFSVLLGERSRGEFLSRKLDYYPCAARARDAVAPNARILVVGEQRGYYIEQPNTVTTPMAANRFVTAANAASGPEDLARKLREEEGIGYLLVVPREGARLGEQYGVFHFSEKGRKNWEGLEKDALTPVFQSPGRCALFKVRTGEK